MIRIKTGVCGSIIQKNKQDILDIVENMDYDNIDYVELRVDTIDNINSKLAHDIIIDMKKICPKPIILTNRTSKEGGHFKGTEEERIKILVDNAPYVHITDVELSTDKHMRSEVINAAKSTIISYHNFEETPDIKILENIINEAYTIGDIPKIALKPHTLEDTYIIVKLMMKYENLIAISMDEIGSYTRIIGPIIGAPITYASIDEKSAPGQLDVKTTNQMIKKLKSSKQ